MAWSISDLETAITNIESVISGRITSDIETYQISGRSITNIPATELLTIRDRLKAELGNMVNAARIEKGLKSKRTIRVRFI